MEDVQSSADALHPQQMTPKPWHQKGDGFCFKREGLKGVSPSRTLKDKVDMAVFLFFSGQTMARVQVLKISSQTILRVV